MEKYTDICEKIEISVFSGDELTQKMKAHVMECDRCRSFLEQNEKLCQDLKQLNVTGVEDGKIADGVMAKIRAERLSKSRKFNFTHHLGTAAALVIICVAALYVKNVEPAENEGVVVLESESAVVEEKSTETKVIKNARFMSADGVSGVNGESEEFADEQAGQNVAYVLDENVSEQSLIDSEETLTDGENGEQQSQALTMKFMAKAPVTDSNAQDVTIVYTDAVNDAISKADVEETVPELKEEKAVAEEKNEEPMRMLMAKPEITDDAVIEGSDAGSLGGGGGSGSSGGGSGGSWLALPERAECEDAILSSEETVDNTVEDDADKYSPDFLVFEGVEFLDGEENFEKNLALANERLSELYGQGVYEIFPFYPENNGIKTNEFFVEYAPFMTYGELVKSQKP